MDELRRILLHIYGDAKKVEAWLRGRGPCAPASEVRALRAWLKR